MLVNVALGSSQINGGDEVEHTRLRGLFGLSTLAVAIAGFAFLAPSAYAAVELQLSSGGTTLTYTGSGGAVSTPSGGVSVGGWTINLTNGVSGGPTSVSMDLSSIDATAQAGVGNLTILLSDTFTSASSAFSLSSSGHLVSGSGMATYSAYYDNTGALFTLTNLIGTLGPFSSGYNVSQTFTGLGDTPTYSITEKVVLTSSLSLSGSCSGTISNCTEWSTDSSITATPVPEPSGILLLGTALAVAGAVIRKKIHLA